MNVTEKTGKVVGMLSVVDSEDLVVMTENGILIRQPIKDIRTIGRNTQGVRLIRLDQDDSIADITVVARDDNELEIGNGGEDDQDTIFDEDSLFENNEGVQPPLL